MIGFSHAASTDMPFSAMLTIAMVCAAVVLGLTRNENTPILPRTPLALLSSFSVSSSASLSWRKALRHFLCGAPIFFWALFAKLRWRDAFRLLHPAAIASFCPHRSSLVHPLRPPQSGFLPHLHHRAQFQTLPHSRIPAHPALLYYVPILLVAVLPWIWNFPGFDGLKGHRPVLGARDAPGMHSFAHLAGPDSVWSFFLCRNRNYPATSSLLFQRCLLMTREFTR